MSHDLAARALDLAKRIDELTPETVEKPTLVYFDIIGICWPIRCLLHVADVDYDLISVPMELWFQENEKGERLIAQHLRNNHIPYYVDPEVAISQSTVLMHYLAEQHDMLGDNKKEKLAISDVIAHSYDALFHWNGMLPVNVAIGIDPDTVEKRLKSFMGDGVWGIATNGYHNHLKGYERYLDANPAGDTGFIVGSRLSIADLHAYTVLYNWYKAFDRETFSKTYPRLDDYARRIGNLPKVADYIDTLQEKTTWLPLPGIGLRLTTPEELTGLRD